MSSSSRTLSVLTSLLVTVTPLPIVGCDEAELPTYSTSSGQPPQSVAVEPSEVGLAVGQTAQLQANIGGVRGYLFPGLTWASSNPDVAIVSVVGLVTARAEGIAIITAQVGKSSAGSRVTVGRIDGRN